jgi:hypothetical protein
MSVNSSLLYYVSSMLMSGAVCFGRCTSAPFYGAVNQVLQWLSKIRVMLVQRTCGCLVPRLHMQTVQVGDQQAGHLI